MEGEEIDFCVPAKRLKLVGGEEHIIKYICTESDNRRKFRIQHLPVELITKILEYMSSIYLLKVVRLVSRDFQDIVLNIIHRRFLLLDNKLRKLYIHSSLKLKEARPLRIKLRAHDLIHYVEMITLQYNLLRASIWRYMENGSSGLLLCHCSGTLLDTFENVIYKIKCQPVKLRVIYNRCLDVDKLILLVRNFISRFQVMVEAKSNANCFVSGAKVVDILDSALFAQRTILAESYENGICKMKVHYRFRDAWFNTSEIRNDLSHYSWEDDQRRMYSRLRSLVLLHTKFYSEDANLKMKTQLNPGRRAYYKSSFGAYAATEEYANRRYYSGCMLPGIYTSLIGSGLTVPPAAKNNCLILDINVDIECPIQYAPLCVYKRHCMDFETIHSKKHVVQKPTRFQTSQFYMNVQFNCDVAKHTNYESQFNFAISEQQRIDVIYKKNLNN